MKHKNQWMVVIVILIACLQLAACSPHPAEEAVTDGGGPATVEHLEGAEPTRITLTEDAAKRLDIQVVEVRTAQVGSKQGMMIPYAAILYDVDGNTWAYTNPEPLVFVRSPIVVDYIDGDQVYLSKGPSAGSAVVTTGATELFGSESEFEEE